MPGGDRTGPMGAGPMTGRGAGYCRGFGMPGYANQGFGGRGRGVGFGGGFGRGRRNRFFAGGFPGRAWNRGFVQDDPMAATGDVASRADNRDELAYLKEQAEYCRATLENINKRLNELQNGRGE